MTCISQWLKLGGVSCSQILEFWNLERIILYKDKAERMDQQDLYGLAGINNFGRKLKVQLS
jgi:hypothetical protein